MEGGRPLGLFEGYGVEIEYMLARTPSLDVLPAADALLRDASGVVEEEAGRGPVRWSNELVLHLLEIKTNGPVPSLRGAAEVFQESVRDANALLTPLGGSLLPTGMHPWMDPGRETRLWPHHCSEVYRTFDRIFDCRGHGWSNLQSAHLNLPFRDDGEFARLHAAIRLLMPILPALTASSPFADGRAAGFLDFRLETYRNNARRVPSVAGRVLPEAVFSREEYEEKILAPIYRDLAPLDPEGTLRHEWVNARGAIARFERNTIEIRVLDVQECPRADLAAAALVSETLRAMTEERWSSFKAQKDWETRRLEAIFLKVVKDADEAVIDDGEYLSAFGVGDAGACAAGDLWRRLFENVLNAAREDAADVMRPAEAMLNGGSLARRIVRAAGPEPDRERLREVYEKLRRCLAEGRLFGVED